MYEVSGIQSLELYSRKHKKPHLQVIQNALLKNIAYHNTKKFNTVYLKQMLVLSIAKRMSLTINQKILVNKILLTVGGCLT